MLSPRITYDEEEDISDESEMEVVVLTDPGGSTMRMQKVDNVVYGTPYKAQVLKQIKYVQLRESDIYLTAFLRTVDSNGMFENLRDAEKFFGENPDIPVHFQIYEETMKDPVAAVKALSDFVGLPRNDDLCHAIAEKCTFVRMKTDKDQYAMKAKMEKATCSGKHNRDVSTGTVGDWRNWFTEVMLDEYYRVYDEKMAGSLFYDRYARHMTQ